MKINRQSFTNKILIPIVDNSWLIKLILHSSPVGQSNWKPMNSWIIHEPISLVALQYPMLYWQNQIASFIMYLFDWSHYKIICYIEYSDCIFHNVPIWLVASQNQMLYWLLRMHLSQSVQSDQKENVNVVMLLWKVQKCTKYKKKKIIKLTHCEERA
jgi:hypothetical protein